MQLRQLGLGRMYRVLHLGWHQIPDGAEATIALIARLLERGSRAA